jgi:hypothetical protein
MSNYKRAFSYISTLFIVSFVVAVFFVSCESDLSWSIPKDATTSRLQDGTGDEPLNEVSCPGYEIEVETLLEIYDRGLPLERTQGLLLVRSGRYGHLLIWGTYDGPGKLSKKDDNYYLERGSSVYGDGEYPRWIEILETRLDFCEAKGWERAINSYFTRVGYPPIALVDYKYSYE